MSYSSMWNRTRFLVPGFWNTANEVQYNWPQNIYGLPNYLQLAIKYYCFSVQLILYKIVIPVSVHYLEKWHYSVSSKTKYTDTELWTSNFLIQLRHKKQVELTKKQVLMLRFEDWRKQQENISNSVSNNWEREGAYNWEQLPSCWRRELCIDISLKWVHLLQTKEKHKLLLVS